MKSLINARLRQLKNTIKESSRSGKRKYLLFLLLASGILGALTLFFVKIFGFLYHEDQFPDFFKLFISEKILMMAFLTMFMMLILSALISTLNIFFLSRDLPLLLSSPLRSRWVFYWKAFEVAGSSSLMVVFFALPLLFSYCYYFAPGFFDVTAIIFIFLLYIISGVLLGIILGLIIPAFFSIRKLQPVLSLFSIVLISSIVIFLRILRPERFGNPNVIDDLLSYMSGLKVGFLTYFPFSWLSKAMDAVAGGNYSAYWSAVGAFSIIVLLLLGFTHFIQKKYYLLLYDKMNKGSKGGYKSSWKKPLLVRGVYTSLWKKEIKTFLRTPAQWTQLLIIGAIMIVFVLNIRGIPMPQPTFKNVIAYLNLGMAAFVVAGLNSRFAFTTIPMEHPGIAHVLASPFQRSHFFRFKLLFYTVPQLIIGFILFFAGDISLHQDTFSRVSGIFFLLPLLPVLTVMALFFSLRIEESVPLTPQHLVGSRSGISYMLWSMIYIISCMIYIARPMYLYYRYNFIHRPVPWEEIILWFGIYWLLNLLIFFILYRKSHSLWRNRDFL